MLEHICVNCDTVLEWADRHLRAPSFSPSAMSAPKNSIGRPGCMEPSSLISRFLTIGMLPLLSSNVKYATETSS